MVISTFKSINRAYVDLRIDLPWKEIANLLINHNDVAEKTQAELFNVAQFKSLDDPTHELGRKYHYVNGVRQSTFDEIPNTVRRSKSNVISISGIVLDVDEKMNITGVIELLDGLEYVLYTTFRHTPEHHKFRVVIPFSRPLMAEDIAGRQESIMEYFPGVDNCSFTQSQSFYFHSGKADPIAFRNEGMMIDPYDFEYREQPVYTPKEATTVRNDDDYKEWREAVTRSLRSCSGLHYDGSNGSTRGVLVLVQICKSIGMSFAEFDYICSEISAPASNLKRPDVRNMAWTGWDRDTATRKTVEGFLKDYSGYPIPDKSPIGRLTDLAMKMREKYSQKA